MPQILEHLLKAVVPNFGTAAQSGRPNFGTAAQSDRPNFGRSALGGRARPVW